MRYITGKMQIVERLKNSYMGNPRYLVNVDGIALYTRPNCSLGYVIKNYRNKTVEAIAVLHYGKLTIKSIESVEE